jgi:hypothetical protein
VPLAEEATGRTGPHDNSPVAPSAAGLRRSRATAHAPSVQMGLDDGCWAAARASAVSGDAAQARHNYTDQALAAAENVADDGDRALVLADLESIPGQPRYW